MINIFRIGLLIISFHGVFTVVHAQNIPDSTIKSIDSLFAKWNSKNTPGFIIGIVRNDSLVFNKGYGMANLEYGIPITENTVFYIASVSKQFTAYCITLLVRQKKLDLNKDIHAYLPWLPDFRKKITIQNLLNHTSGFRDHLNMIAISGLGIDGVLTNDQVIRTIKMQQQLNFTPGERFSYSNTNYVLLAEIIRTVSGRSLRQFADSSIFKPLQMINTHFHDNPSEITANQAVSYWQEANEIYANAFQNVYTVGDGGMMTTVKDVSKWITNFYEPRAGDMHDIESLAKTGKLTSGKQLSYAGGINVGIKNGWKTWSHAGALHGYNAIISVYPELKTGFIILGNTRNGGIAEKITQLANLIIPPGPSAPATNLSMPGKNENVSNDSAFLSKYTGEYISDDGYLLTISWRDGNLSGSGFGQNFKTTGKETGTRFLFPSKNNPLTKIVFPGGAKGTEFNLEFPDEILHFTKLDSSTLLKPGDIAGMYYSPELDCTYKIILRDGDLFLSNNKYPDSKLVLRETHLKRDSWFMNHMKIITTKNKISGFEVNAGNVMHLRFIKVER